MVVQKLHKEYSLFECAKKYYTVLFDVNNLSVTDGEIALVAFCAIHGTISTPPVRDKFITEFESSRNTIYNMTAKLQQMGIMVKRENKIKVNPLILPDFSKGILLQIKMDVVGDNGEGITGDSNEA